MVKDYHFNSHAHVERDGVFAIFVKFFTNFNSHAHVERDYNQYHMASYLCHFNSHAHVERDIQTKTENLELKISTHTLTWSVTFCRFCYLLYLNYFNSHAHVERDWNIQTAGVKLEISTHTLTWSVTSTNVHMNRIAQFQLTRSRGA